jgi:hypothetical protein
VRTLQNWAQRGLLELELDDVNPGKGAVRLYSGWGIVVLQFMQTLVELGIPPSAAREMADEIGGEVLDLHRSYPTEERANTLRWIVDAATAHTLRRAVITKLKGKYSVRIERGDLNNVLLTLTPDAYIVVQLDMLCLAAFNRIYAFIAKSSEQKK